VKIRDKIFCDVLEGMVWPKEKKSAEKNFSRNRMNLLPSQLGL
jgi:hypothetical protein